MAVDTEDGFFLPVLRNIGGREAADLRRGIEAMKRDVRARSVPLAELRGQTITLSNFGMFGGRFAALVIVPPRLRSSAPTASPVILAASEPGDTWLSYNSPSWLAKRHGLGQENEAMVSAMAAALDEVATTVAARP